MATTPQTPAVPLHLQPSASGVPSGPSVQELMLVIEKMQQQISSLMSTNLPSTAEVSFEPVEKTYFHQTPGSNFVVTRRGPRGEHIPEMLFFDFRGSLVTKDPAVQEFLDEIADRPGVPIYTHKAPAISAEAAAAASEVIKSAAKTIDKLGSEARAAV